MTFTKYPSQIEYYHDLFEGNFFSSENQALFAADTVSQNIKNKIFVMLQKEQKILQQASTLRGYPRDIHKALSREKQFPVSSAAVHPIDYFNTLNDTDKANLQRLLFDIFYGNQGKGIYYDKTSYIETVLAVGSTTYPDDYWTGFDEYDIDAATQQRVALRGNDIDLQLIQSNHIVSLANYIIEHEEIDYNYLLSRSGSYYLQKYVLQHICRILDSCPSVTYIYDESVRKNGTDYIRYQSKDKTKKLHQYEVHDYTTPHMTIYFPQGRPIHITVARERGHDYKKREYLQGRPYSPLFSGVRERIESQQVLQAIIDGQDMRVPHSLHDRYDILTKNRKRLYQQRLSASIKQRKEEKSCLVDGGEFPF